MKDTTKAAVKIAATTEGEHAALAFSGRRRCRGMKDTTKAAVKVAATTQGEHAALASSGVAGGAAA